MKKILWIDTETTGLDAQRHSLIQLAMLMDIDGKVEGEFNLKIQPFPKDIIEISWDSLLFVSDFGTNDISLPITDAEIDDIRKYISPFDAMTKISQFLDLYISKFDKNDKAWVGGYNVGFDMDTLSSFCKKAGFAFLGSYINWQRLDVLHALYQETYKSGQVYADYKLSTVCELYGIELNAHDAMSDIKATRELWYKLEAGNG